MTKEERAQAVKAVMSALSVWFLGLGLFLIGPAMLLILVALWPIRVSDAPPGSNPRCDVAVVPQPNVSGRPSASPPPAGLVVPSPGPSTPPVRRALAAAQAEAIDPWDRCVSLFGGEPTPIPFDVRLLWLVAVSAAFGSYVHIATSFATRVANHTFEVSWTWWYVLRIPIGVALAVVVYMAFRGGLLTASALSDTAVNPFGLCALAALVGLFSRQAIDKLRETFDTLFRTATDQSRGKPVPLSITSVMPNTFGQATPPASLAVAGTGFMRWTKATINGTDRRVSLTDATHLQVQLEAADTAGAGTLKLELSNGSGQPVSSTVTVT